MTDSEREGTFLVTAVDEDSAVLKDVETGQVHTLASNPGVERHEALTGVLAPEPPMNVTWRLVSVEDRWTISLERSEETPTAQVRDIAAAQGVGELTREPRVDAGELHVITVPESQTERAADDVLSDAEATLSRAARLGVRRVEVRTTPGVVSVRYLP